MASIRGVLLDFYGTVVEEDDAIIARIVDNVRRDAGASVVEAMADEWWRSFTDLCAKAHGDAFRPQRVLERESLGSALALVGSSLDPDTLSDELFRYWQRPTIHPDGKRFIESTNLPICIVSNIDRADLDAALSHHNFEAELVVTSEDARAYKPRAEMFALALEQLALTADEVVHIGDSVSSDVVGARGAGLRAIWVNRSAKSAPAFQPTATVTNLDHARRFIVAANAVDA